MKEAACTAIHGDINQYAVTWGTPVLRQAIAEKYRRWYNMEVDHDRDVTVTCGATEAMASVFMALMDPGDEVIILEPFYENYGPDAILAGAKPVFVPLERPNWTLDLGSPAQGVQLAHEGDHRQHAAQSDGPRAHARRDVADRRVSASSTTAGRSPTRRTSTWCTRAITTRSRRGPACASVRSRFRHCPRRSAARDGESAGSSRRPRRPAPIRKVHDFLTVGAPAPLQTAAAVGFAFDADYYNHFTSEYRARREFLCGVLQEEGFEFAVPEGAYYIFADFSKISDLDDVTFAKWMTQEIGVATVPGSSFYSRKEDGRSFVRFAFCKKQETLEHAAERLSKLRATI